MRGTFLLAACSIGASVTASAETAKTLYDVGEATTTAVWVSPEERLAELAPRLFSCLSQGLRRTRRGADRFDQNWDETRQSLLTECGSASATCGRAPMVSHRCFPMKRTAS